MSIKLIDGILVLISDEITSVLMPGIFKSESKEDLQIDLDTWKYRVNGEWRQLPNKFMLAIDHKTVSLSGFSDIKREIRLYEKGKDFTVLYKRRFNTFVISSCSHICWECFHYDKKKWKCKMKLEEGNKKLANKIFN